MCMDRYVDCVCVHLCGYVPVASAHASGGFVGRSLLQPVSRDTAESRACPSSCSDQPACGSRPLSWPSEHWNDRWVTTLSWHLCGFWGWFTLTGLCSRYFNHWAISRALFSLIFKHYSAVTSNSGFESVFARREGVSACVSGSKLWLMVLARCVGLRVTGMYRKHLVQDRAIHVSCLCQIYQGKTLKSVVWMWVRMYILVDLRGGWKWLGASKRFKEKDRVEDRVCLYCLQQCFFTFRCIIIHR